MRKIGGRMYSNEFEGTAIEWTQEPLQFVDATPDEDYVLRILRAHLHHQEAGRWTDNTEGNPPTNPLLIAMNAAVDKRVRLLRSAIAKLERTR